MIVPSGKQPESGPLARAISAEIRALMARQRLSGVRLADRAGLSRNYFGKRLRDEAPFTLNDVEAICKALGEDLEHFITSAAANAKRGRNP